MRSKDLATLSGLEQVYGQPVEERYISTEERELMAWREAMKAQGLGDTDELDEEDYENLRTAL